MDNNRLTFGAAANFEGCFEVIRVNCSTERCDFLGRSAELSDKEPTIGEYFARLMESGWIHPADSEAYSHYFDFSRMKERLANGKVILNGIRVKPADVYLWTDFEMICPKSCPQSIFIFIRSLKRTDRPAASGYRMLMAVNPARNDVFPIIAPFGDFNNFRGALEYYIDSFGGERSALSAGERRIFRTDGGLTMELDPCRGEGTGDVLAAVYETEAVSSERRKEIYDYYGKIDASTGLLNGYFVRKYANSSEDSHIAAMLISAEGSDRNKALCIFRQDFYDSAFARDTGELAVVLTARSESRLRYGLGALCRRLSDTGGDFMIKIAMAAQPTSAEEVLENTESSEPQTPRDFQWSGLQVMKKV